MNNALASSSSTLDSLRFISVNDLLLDPENPRLPESVLRNQQAMLDYIAETTSIEELMDAIAENDFFPGEPLIAVEGCGDEAGKFIVVEGNRRLTAVKLLLNPDAYDKAGSRMRDIAARAKFRPPELPIIVRPSRDAVLPYLGFRHITGVKQWEPLAKARYIEQLFHLSNASLTPKERYGEVARSIGSRSNHIKRNLDALAAYKIIKEADFYEIPELDDASLKFAVLSTALADERIGVFAGVSSKIDDEVVSNDSILNLDKLERSSIQELTRWLFEKDAKGKTKIGESRNLRELAAVVCSTRALAALRNGSTLKIAYQQTSDQTKDFVELLYAAEAALTEAASMVATVTYADEAYEAARRIQENIKLIGRALKDKHEPNDEF